MGKIRGKTDTAMQPGGRPENGLRGCICLMGAAFIWGVAFVAQRVGMDYVGPFTFNCVRCMLGFLILLPLIAGMDRRRRYDRMIAGDRQPEGGDFPGTGFRDRTLLRGGLVTGALLFVASNLQQVGLQYTSVGKAGFITALYIVMVPILGSFAGRKASGHIWICVVMAVAGLYLLCMTENLALSGGDALVLLCAVAFAFQIMAVDRYGRLVDGTKLACLEFFVCAALTAVPMFLFENPVPADLWAARVPIAYAGFLSCGVAYTLQIIGQRELRPAVASLIMSFESVISVLAGWLILGQRLTAREICGCVIMFAAIVLAQMPRGEKPGKTVQSGK